MLGESVAPWSEAVKSKYMVGLQKGTRQEHLNQFILGFLEKFIYVGLRAMAVSVDMCHLILPLCGIGDGNVLFTLFKKNHRIIK